MLCRWCGADSPDQSQTCSHCGKASPFAEAAPRNEPAPDLQQRPQPETHLFALALERFRQLQSTSAAPMPALRIVAAIAMVAAVLAIAIAGIHHYTRRDSSLAEIIGNRYVLPQAGNIARDPAPQPAAASEIREPAAAASSSLASGLPPQGQQTKRFAATTKPTNPHPASHSKRARHHYRAEFRGAFGQVVETRTYASRKMRTRALALWERQGRILEPDGSIQTPPPTAPPPSPSPIPGH